MYVSTPWEVKTASCNTNPTHSLTFFLIYLIVGWVHTLHDSGLIIMITQHSLGNHFFLFHRITVWQFFPNKSTLWLSYSILLMVQKSCTTWDAQYPVNCGIFTQYQPILAGFFPSTGISMSLHQPSRIWHPWRSFWTKKPGWMRFLKMRCRGAEMRSWNSGPTTSAFCWRWISMVRSRW